MKKYHKIILLFIMSFLLTGCFSEKYNLNEETTLKGIVHTNEIIKDNQSYMISILELDNPIIIEGTKINKIAIDYDKTLRDDTEVTIDGTITDNDNQNLDLTYSIKVNDIDNILSYINTFSNDTFSVTIPTEIIKICDIKSIDNGFSISKKDKNQKSVTLFNIIAVSNEEFNNLRENESISIEKVTSNKEKTIIVLYSTEEYENDDYTEYNKIISNIDKIKDTVVMK